MVEHKISLFVPVCFPRSESLSQNLEVEEPSYAMYCAQGLISMCDLDRVEKCSDVQYLIEHPLLLIREISAR